MGKFVRNGGDGVNVGDVGVGVAQRFDVDGAGILLHGGLDLRQVVRVHKGGLHVKGGQRVRQQVGGAAVDGLLRNGRTINGKRSV